MKAKYKVLNVILGLVIPFTSFAFLDSNQVKAATSNLGICTDIVDDFSDISSTSEKWASEVGTNAIENGVIKMQADEIDEWSQLLSSFVSLNDPDTNELDYMLSGDWTMTFEMDNISSDTTDPDNYYYIVGADLLELNESGNFTAAASMFVSAGGNLSEVMVASSLENGAYKAESAQNLNRDSNEPIKFKYVKTGTTIKASFGQGSTYKLLYTFNDFTEAPYFRFLLNVETTDNTLNNFAEVDNFKLECDLDQYVDGTVFRFFNSSTNGHFYTADPAEAEYLRSSNPSWDYEGPVFAAYAYTTECADGTEVYRFYNASSGRHFYTADLAEKEYIEDTNPAWDYEAVAYCASETAGTGLIGMHQFYSSQYKGHFYTIDTAEKEWVEDNLPQYKYEAVVYYVQENE